MASLDELLQQADSLISSTSTFAPSAPVPSTSSAGISLTPMQPASSIGADLLGTLDTEYAGRKPLEPGIGDILYAALPSRKTAVETGKGILELAKMGVGAGTEFLTTTAEERAIKQAAEEAKQLEIDTKAAAAANIPLDAYRAAKKEEKRTALLDMIGRTGAEVVGGIGGGALGFFSPVPGGTMLGAYGGAGAGAVAYEKLKEAIGNYLEPGSVPKKTALEYAQIFEQGGTPELVTAGLGGALRATGKASAKTGQKLSDVLGPATKEEALGRASAALEDTLPSAKVRTKFAGQSAQQQTAGMQTTAEVLGTPEAYIAEQAIGLHPFNKDAFNVRIGENVVKSQDFLLDDLTKTIQAKASPENVKLLKQPEITDEVTGTQIKTAIEKAEEKIKNEVSLEYAPLDLTETIKPGSLKSKVYDILKKKYGTIPTKPKKGAASSADELSTAIPSEVQKLSNEIRNSAFQEYTVEQLQIWQVRARGLAKKLANDPIAQSAVIAIRKTLKDKILETKTGKKYWVNATKEAKNAYDVFENHFLGKILDKDRPTMASFYESIIKNPENFKNFKIMIQNNPEMLDALKAKAISELKNTATAGGTDTVRAAAARAKWITNNSYWLKEVFTGDEFKRVKEMATRGQSMARRSDITNPLGGSPTATRTISSKYGLSKALKTGETPVSQVQKAEMENNKLLRQALMYGGGTIGAGVLGGQLGGYTGIPVGMLGAIMAIRGGSKRIARGQDLLREAAFDIAMNPKTAGWTAPKLAKALAERRAGQVGKFERVGEKAGQITGRTAQATRRVPTEEEKQVAEFIVQQPDAYLAIDELSKKYLPQGQAPKTEETKEAPKKPATPKVLDVRRIKTTETEAENYLKSRPAIIQAIAEVESGRLGHKAVSKVGARGRMQLMPKTAEELGVDINDPMQNVQGGEKYYNQMKKQYGKYGDEFALAAYNWGPGRVAKAIKKVRESGADVTWQNVLDTVYVPKETKNYVKKVLSKSKQIKA